eukprot:jgi/Galph1/3468/GphlegSOOS_G2150.1
MQQNPAFSYPTAPENEYMAYQMPTTNTMQTPSFPTTQVQSPTTPSTVYMMPQGNGTHAESATVTQKTANFNAVSSSNLKFDKTPQTIICPNCGEKVVTRATGSYLFALGVFLVAYFVKMDATVVPLPITLVQIVVM